VFGDRQHAAPAAGGLRLRHSEVPPENALIACLGAAFEQLPEMVRQAHHGTVQLTGTVRVERGGGLGGLIALLLGLPRTDPAAALVVTAWHFPDQLVWSRSFSGRMFETTFMLEGDHLVERTGPIALHLRPMAEGSRLVYRLAAAQLGPLPLPRFLCPAITAWEGEKDGRYAFEVAVSLPLFGRVIRYGGTLDLAVLAVP
jgi:hypothetical protein